MVLSCSKCEVSTLKLSRLDSSAGQSKVAEIHLTTIRRLTYTFKAQILPPTLITYATQTSLFDTSGP